MTNDADAPHTASSPKGPASTTPSGPPEPSQHAPLSPAPPSANTTHRRFVRPVIAYLAAIAAAAPALALTILLVDESDQLISNPLGFSRMLLAFSVISAVFMAILTPLPAIALWWLAHLRRAPRPAADIMIGALLGVISPIAAGPIMFGRPPRLRDDEWAAFLVFALAGALGGLTYALLIGPRTPRPPAERRIDADAADA